MNTRSSRSAPECLESGRCVSIATIDAALGELRAAFEDEAKVRARVQRERDIWPVTPVGDGVCSRSKILRAKTGG